MKPSTPIQRLKRRARRLSREAGVPLHVALDRVAMTEGFARWSLLAARAPTPRAPAAAVLARLDPGDLVLLGARPGHGKTLTGLGVIMDAVERGRQAWFFTLASTLDETLERVRKIGRDPSAFARHATFDDSDRICAGHVVARLSGADRGAVAVVDYLQLLDERREHPVLGEQVAALRAFARGSGTTLVLISQIDRSYDPTLRPCPELDDVRLPNPVDLALFDKTCFLHAGEVRVSAPGDPAFATLRTGR